MTASTAQRMTRLTLCVTLLIGAWGAASFVEPGVAVAAPSDDPVLTPEEQALAALMSPQDAARYRLQEELQRSSEVAALLAQMQQLRHETAVSVINAIR